MVKWEVQLQTYFTNIAFLKNIYKSADKDLAQWVFSCCGFTANDDAAYRGEPNYAGQGPNLCVTQPTNLPGCQEAGTNYWNSQVRSLGVSLAIGIIVILVSIGAAYNAKLGSKVAVTTEYAVLRDEKMPASYKEQQQQQQQQPLIPNQ